MSAEVLYVILVLGLVIGASVLKSYMSKGIGNVINKYDYSKNKKKSEDTQTDKRQKL